MGTSTIRELSKRRKELPRVGGVALFERRRLAVVLEVIFSTVVHKQKSLRKEEFVPNFHDSSLSVLLNAWSLRAISACPPIGLKKFLGTEADQTECLCARILAGGKKRHDQR